MKSHTTDQANFRHTFCNKTTYMHVLYLFKWQHLTKKYLTNLLNLQPLHPHYCVLPNSDRETLNLHTLEEL